MKPGASRCSGISPTVEEKVGKPWFGDRLIKAVRPAIASNEVGRNAQYVKKGEGRKEEKDGVRVVFFFSCLWVSVDIWVLYNNAGSRHLSNLSLLILIFCDLCSRMKILNFFPGLENSSLNYFVLILMNGPI